MADWGGVLQRIQSMFGSSPVPNTPYPPAPLTLPRPPLANPIGHQESPGAGGAFFSATPLPSGPQTFSNLQTGAPIYAPGGFGLASSRDINARQREVQGQNRQAADNDVMQNSGLSQSQLDQMRNIAFGGGQQQKGKPRSTNFYGE